MDRQEKIRPILYGVTDFARIRRENAYFVDKTGLIAEIEKTSFVLFLRPRRFGKSLLLSVLQCYYDVDYADRFDELFGGLAIYDHPTPERGKYLVLTFNFSAVEKTVDRVQESFNENCSDQIDEFVSRHRAQLPEGTVEKVHSKSNCHLKLNALTMCLQGQKNQTPLYVLIDEYDNFTNTILANSREAYEQLCRGEGFFKQFFVELKAATTGTDAPVSRLFITGVTPVTMDDVTSGFNIGDNMSLERGYSELVGFTHDEVKAMIDHYATAGALKVPREKAYRTMLDWFDGYRFARGDVQPVCNSVLALGFMKHALSAGGMPDDLVDENLRMDYGKIRHLITESHRINGNYHKLEDVLAKKDFTASLAKSFQARDIAKNDNFVSLLYYFGLLTVKGIVFGDVELGIPNLTMTEFMSDFVPCAYEDVYGISPRVFNIARGMRQFAQNGDWRPAMDELATAVGEYFAVRDALEGERVVQTAFTSLLTVAHGPFIVRHEREMNGGFCDVTIAPQLSRWPEIAAGAVIELKYLKKEDDASPAAFDKLKAEAIAQLDRYVTDHDLAREWNLKPAGTVELVRLVIVFQGGDRVLCARV